VAAEQSKVVSRGHQDAILKVRSHNQAHKAFINIKMVDQNNTASLPFGGLCPCTAPCAPAIKAQDLSPRQLAHNVEKAIQHTHTMSNGTGHGCKVAPNIGPGVILKHRNFHVAIVANSFKT
jgi:hypothetical protein